MKRLGIPISVGLAIVALFLVFALAGCGSSQPKPQPILHLLKSAQSPQAAQKQLSDQRRAEGFAQPPKGDFGLSKPNATVRVLRGCDAVNVSACHARDPVQVFPCYVTGFVNCASGRAIFPNAQHPTISLISSVPADYYDIEPGGGSISLAVNFYRLDRARGIKPGFYTSGSNWPALDATLQRAGIPRSAYNRWIADWDGNPAVPFGFKMKQWASPGGVYDADTEVSTSTPAPAPQPAPKPKPKPVVYNFTWFCHTKPAAGLIGGPYAVRFNEAKAETGKDFNNERSIYHLYVTARAKSQTGKRVRYVAELKEEAHGLFQRLEGVIHHSSRQFNLQFHRYGRANVLKAIYEGHAHVSWSAVNG